MTRVHQAQSQAAYLSICTEIQLERTRRVRSHADDWLRHLANVNEARIKHQQSRRRPVTTPSEYRRIAVLVCKMDLLTL